MAPHGFLQWCIRSFCQGVVCFRRMRTGACGVARRLSPTGRPGVPNGGAQRSIAVMVHALLARRPTQRPGAPTVGPSGLLQSWPRSFCQGAVCFRRVRPGAREVTRRMPTAGRPGAPNGGSQRPVGVMARWPQTEAPRSVKRFPGGSVQRGLQYVDSAGLTYMGRTMKLPSWRLASKRVPLQVPVAPVWTAPGPG